MTVSKTIWATLLAGVLLDQSYIFAEERVARLSTFVETIGPGTLVQTTVATMTSSQKLTGVNAISPAHLAQHTFVVYTKEEVDAHRNQQITEINSLKDALETAKKNLKALADLNDALTKRLDDLEKKSASGN